MDPHTLPEAEKRAERPFEKHIGSTLPPTHQSRSSQMSNHRSFGVRRYDAKTRAEVIAEHLAEQFTPNPPATSRTCRNIMHR
ncbi:hypothetical protein EVAR_67534_1 [Eumeta japonica]|uniref:Uncharacterized protein n=1 Tax=Eumeta variegata TaxID=151549 RepID=A0A4C1ZZT4_EUMVA|nr:hypothetical protein EVAR_67534_1 [Eumeta japonica]